MTRRFGIWLAAATLSHLGDGLLYFAVAWTATGISPRTAGLMFTLIVLPRTVLMLLGGAVGDRYGVRRTLVACHTVMCLLLAVSLVATGSGVSAASAIWVLALGLGVVSAFSLPASGAMPRLFVPPDALPRAMAMTGSLLQIARLAGPPLGGVIVAALAMEGAVAAALVSSMAFLVALLFVRPPYEQPPDDVREPARRRIMEGLRAARSVPGVVPILAAVALVAGALIPMLSLCVPLAARERGWSAGETGLVETAWIVGSLGVSLLVARTSTLQRPLGALVIGPVAVSAGVLILAETSSLPVGLAGAWVMGVGTATFTTHVFPAYLSKTPDGMLARFQSLLGVVQAAPMLVSNGVLAIVADYAGARGSLLVVAAMCLAASVAVASSRELRNLHVGSGDPSASRAEASQVH